MNSKRVTIIGLMLFSLFFGAGNLIFPPLLGMESGNAFVPAISGFILTGVFLPFIAVLVVVVTNGGLVEIGSRVHKVFGILFAIIIYLSIGPLYAIPRTATVAYELSFQQFFPTAGNWTLIVFSALFFLLALYVCLRPQKIVDWIGQWLTPVLLGALALLFIRAFFQLDYTNTPVAEKYAANPFLTGFIEGYFTLDAVAALAFGVVVVNALKDSGVQSKKNLLKGSIGAGLIAAFGLALVYIALGWIGVVIPRTMEFTNGAELLTAASQLLFGSFGSFLFSVIVLLACFTTCAGLINACGSFFHELYPKFRYQTYAIGFTVIGFLISSLGLNTLLNSVVPVLLLIYPVAIVLMALSLLQPLIGAGKMMYRLAVTLTLIYAVHDALVSLGLNLDWAAQWIGFVPFFNLGLGWTIPAVVGSLIGFIIDKLIAKDHPSVPAHGKN